MKKLVEEKRNFNGNCLQRQTTARPLGPIHQSITKFKHIMKVVTNI